MLVANEVIRSRAYILSENITKWGKPNVIVTNSDPAELGKLENFFDMILTDTPCSGEGMFRKDETAVNEWSETNVQFCRERQRRILSAVWNALKPGGLLLYSTCTYNTGENEDNVQWICSELGAETMPVNIQEEWNITGALKGGNPVYRFLPHKTKGEGFFLAVMRKTDESSSAQQKKGCTANKDSRKAILPLPAAYRSLLKNPADFSLVPSNGKQIAFPSIFAEDYNRLAGSLRIISAGIELGEQKGRDFIPAHSLAMSQYLNKNAFRAIETDWESALSYLRKESATLPPEIERGYMLLTCKHVPLGFVKNIGNRANNLYPSEWRIRKKTAELSAETLIYR
jgi:NOL1/NOP2/fmu family ribosome biogenesis protein